MTGLTAAEVEAWLHGSRAAAKAIRQPSAQQARLNAAVVARSRREQDRRGWLSTLELRAAIFDYETELR